MKFSFRTGETRRIPLVDDDKCRRTLDIWINGENGETCLVEFGVATLKGSLTGWILRPVDVVNEEFLVVEVVAEMSVLVGKGR
jgi:hypothetical protein